MNLFSLLTTGLPFILLCIVIVAASQPFDSKRRLGGIRIQYQIRSRLKTHSVHLKVGWVDFTKMVRSGVHAFTFDQMD